MKPGHNNQNTVTGYSQACGTWDFRTSHNQYVWQRYLSRGTKDRYADPETFGSFFGIKPNKDGYRARVIISGMSLSGASIWIPQGTTIRDIVEKVIGRSGASYAISPDEKTVHVTAKDMRPFVQQPVGTAYDWIKTRFSNVLGRGGGTVAAAHFSSNTIGTEFSKYTQATPANGVGMPDMRTDGGGGVGCEMRSVDCLWSDGHHMDGSMRRGCAWNGGLSCRLVPIGTRERCVTELHKYRNRDRGCKMSIPPLTPVCRAACVGEENSGDEPDEQPPGLIDMNEVFGAPNRIGVPMGDGCRAGEECCGSPITDKHQMPKLVPIYEDDENVTVKECCDEERCGAPLSEKYRKMPKLVPIDDDSSSSSVAMPPPTSAKRLEEWGFPKSSEKKTSMSPIPERLSKKEQEEFFKTKSPTTTTTTTTTGKNTNEPTGIPTYASKKKVFVPFDSKEKVGSCHGMPSLVPLSAPSFYFAIDVVERYKKIIPGFATEPTFVLIPCDDEARREFEYRGAVTSTEKHVLASDEAMKVYMSRCSGRLPMEVATRRSVVDRIDGGGLVLAVDVPGKFEPMRMHLAASGANEDVVVGGSCNSRTAKEHIFVHPKISNVVVIGLTTALVPSK